VYHTDKQLTYHLSQRGVTKELSADAVLTSKVPEGGSSWYKGMYSIYTEAIHSGYTGAARFEARIPIWNAHHILRTLSPATLLRTTLVISPKVIW
jgi:hypothetical protein